jgi:hypothetical protein
VSLVIRNVTVVHPRSGRSIPGQDVHVGGDLIMAVMPTGTREVDQTTQILDGTGRYLVPGFMDMHAHPMVMEDPAANLKLLLAFGVTSFRQMSGSPELLERRAAGTLLPDDSPRLMATPGTILTPFNAGTPAMAVDSVREQKEQGADFVKAGLMTSEAFHAAQVEANRLDIPLLGHLPAGIDVHRASGEGMASIEHLGPGMGLLSCCTAGTHDDDEHEATLPVPPAPPTQFPFT